MTSCKKRITRINRSTIIKYCYYKGKRYVYRRNRSIYSNRQEKKHATRTVRFYNKQLILIELNDN